MKIAKVGQDSIGSELGLKAGDRVLRINGQTVKDIIDYRFLVSEEALEVEVLQDGQRVLYDIEKDFEDDLGLEFPEIEIRYCGNDCPFCFVDQNPDGMRSALYFRDEDYRLSFLSGHYVTLTNLSRFDMERIVHQRLSPLFVSVHATEPEVRKFLFGIKHDDGLADKLHFLTKHDIELHTQIVLCPGINDGDILKKTIWDLAVYAPNLKSVSVVPVGLTRHRQGLLQLEAVTGAYAKQALETLDGYASRFIEETGEHFVYAADEFYIMANVNLPEAGRYDGFYQKENGVGMVRYLLDDFQQQKQAFPERLSKPVSASLVTSTLCKGFMTEEILPVLNQTANLEARLEVVENRFYGPAICITGLLTGQDIYHHLKKVNPGDMVFLPGNCVKDHQLFLDDWTVDRLERELQRPVHVIDHDFTDIFSCLGRLN